MNEPQPIPRKVPDYMRSKGGIWFWTGAMIMVIFFYEVITGLILFFYYQPSNAYTSTENVLTLPYGTVILTTHLYGAYLMIGLVYLHLIRNMIVGSYKHPREMQWLSGVLLLILTVAVAYFGYSMTGDVLSSDATDVGRGIAGAVPFIGSYLSSIVLGNGTSLSLFSRLEGWHILLAGSILLLFAVHFYLAEYNTIMPKAEDVNFNVPAIDKDKPSYKPWYPYNLLYMIQVALFSLALVFIIPSILSLLPNVPALFSPFPQVSATSPLAASVPPYPPWFLLFVYKELDFQISASMGPFWAVALFTGLPLIYLLLLPYIERSNTLKITKRPIVVATAVVGIIYLIGLSYWGAAYPGVPVMNVVALLFFIIPMVIVIPLTYMVAKRIENGKTSLGPKIWKVYSLIPLIGFFALLTGISLYSAITSRNYLYYGATIFLLMMLALSLLALYATLYGLKINPVKTRLSNRGYVFFGSFYAFLAITILSIISSIPPTKIENQALYGLGLGLIFVLGGAFIKLYRSYAFNE